MKEKKYKLIESETTEVDGRTLYRIEAVRDFDNVKKGDKGGYVEGEWNLAQIGNCWVYDEAKVYGGAKVFGDAMVFDNARVFEDAMVYLGARICDNAMVYGRAKVCEQAMVVGNAVVFDGAIVGGNALVLDHAMVFGNAQVHGRARVYDNARVFWNAQVFENARVLGNAQVYSMARVYGNAEIADGAMVGSDKDYIVFKNWWSSSRYFTWTRSNNMWRVGCFYGTGEELIKKAYSDSEVSGREYERIVKYVEEILRDGRE